MKYPKNFISLNDLKYEIKIGNKIIADRTIKNILIREINNRNLIK